MEKNNKWNVEARILAVISLFIPLIWLIGLYYLTYTAINYLILKGNKLQQQINLDNQQNLNIQQLTFDDIQPTHISNQTEQNDDAVKRYLTKKTEAKKTHINKFKNKEEWEEFLAQQEGNQ